MYYFFRRNFLRLYFAHVLFFYCLRGAGYCEATSSGMIAAQEGSDAVLPCDYQHPEPDPPPRVVEWLRQGRELPVYIKIGRYSPHVDPAFEDRMEVVPGKADLVIRRIEDQDDGWYECRVIFLRKDKGNGESRIENRQHVNGSFVKLVVTAPPAFKYTPPDTITRREGEVLLLRCRAVGRPTPVITWLKDEWPIRNGQDGIRLSEGELAVATLRKIHKGRYTCRAQNVEGQIDQSTTVYIQGAPVFTTFPHNANVKEGQDAMFSCRAEGYPTSVQYTWFYNDEPVEDANEIRGRFGTLRDETTFVIYNVVANDGGTVTCRASNGFGKAPSASATLVVQFPARVSKMPSFHYAGLGLRTVLPCPAVAVPPVSTVTWHKNGQLLRLDQDARLSLGENGSLAIVSVGQRDAARYTCIPYNILGTLGESTGTRLIVRNPPHFTTRPKPSYHAEIGKELVVPCDGAGDPPPHVSWTKIGVKTAKGEVQDEDSRLSYESGNLTIRYVVKSDHGTWQCVLSNAVATVTRDVTIYVKYTTPHAVDNVTVTTSRHSALISWRPGYNGGHTQHFMIWYKRADESDHSWQTHSVSTYRKMATVSGLVPDTIYSFALLPENVLGSGLFSKTVTAKTKEMPPPMATNMPETVPPPGRLDRHVTDDGLLLLMWQPPMDAHPDDLLGYVVEFRMLSGEKEEEELQRQDDEATSEKIPEAPLQRFKRSSAESGQQWSAWGTLATVNSSQTSLVVPNDKLYRDQMYEFGVLAMSNSAYSLPSAPITVSTKGMDTYPIFVEPAAYTTAQGMSTAVIAGIVAATVFVAFVIALTSVALCHQKRKRKRTLANDSFRFGETNDERSRSKSKSISQERDDLNGFGSKTAKTGFFKLKKKGLRVDIKAGRAYSSKEELTRLTHKGGTEQPNKHGGVLIRKISRAADGKFHASIQSSAPSDSFTGDLDSLAPESKSGASGMSPLRISERNSFGSRSRSAEWDAKPPLSGQTPGSECGNESLEIDCSHSDIEVRYVKDGRGNGWNQSASMSRLAGSRIHGALLQIGRMDYSMGSSTGAGNFQQPPRQNNRHSVMPRVSSHAQYARATPRKNRNPEYRVSSPPRFWDYNPTPASPPKYRYHKHSDQPGGHYHVSPRESYSNPAGDRLAYDPRFTTRIEPIYEMGGPHQPSNRHSSFVVDSMRELSDDHLHPHRAFQIRGTGVEENVISTPLRHDQAAALSRTLPRSQTLTMASSAVTDQNGVQASLLRHSANATSPNRKEALNGTSSLGRQRKKGGGSSRRRIHSMNDLTTKESYMPETELPQDRTRDGSEAGDDATDVTASSDAPRTSPRVVNSRGDELTKSSVARVVVNAPNSPIEDDSSAISSLVRAPTAAQHHRPLEITSSGYDSHASGSSAPSCASPKAAVGLPCPDRDRTSTASSSDRSRRDNSSVDEKYEWDSELAMESEILDALRHFGTHKRSRSMSQALVDEIRKLGVDKLQEMGRDELASLEMAVADRKHATSAEETTCGSAAVDTSDMYTKESMERRCAALKQEYHRYRLEQSSLGQICPAGANDSVFSATSANA